MLAEYYKAEYEHNLRKERDTALARVKELEVHLLERGQAVNTLMCEKTRLIDRVKELEEEAPGPQMLMENESLRARVRELASSGAGQLLYERDAARDRVKELEEVLHAVKFEAARRG